MPASICGLLVLAEIGITRLLLDGFFSWAGKAYCEKLLMTALLISSRGTATYLA